MNTAEIIAMAHQKAAMERRVPLKPENTETGPRQYTSLRSHTARIREVRYGSK